MWFTGLYTMGKDKWGIERRHCIECECDEKIIALFSNRIPVNCMNIMEV